MTTPLQLDALHFEAPGPGPWEAETAHLPRPCPRIFQEIVPPRFARAFSAMTLRYGVLLSHLQYAFVHEIPYVQEVPAPAEEIPSRFANAERALGERLWRQDLARWDGEVKPAAIRRHLELQGVELKALGDEELLDHLDECIEHSGAMIEQHHHFNGATILPTGDLLNQVGRWADLPPAQLLRCLRGSAPVSAGWSPQLEALAEALRHNDAARGSLDASAPARELVETLRRWPGAVGAAARAYLAHHEWRIADGFTPGEPCAIEVPEVLVTAIRAAVAADGPADAQGDADQTAELVRSLLPDDRRAEFDELLAEARLTYRLRDERGIYSDVWAAGILRRAMLEAGRRLAERGRVAEPVHAVEAGAVELFALVRGTGGPSAEDLAERARFRAGARTIDAPQELGPPSPPPPPMDELPPAVRRVNEAFVTVIQHLFGNAEAAGTPAQAVRGIGASPGIVEGRARVLSGPDEIGLLERGDVLVTTSTSEAFNQVLPLLGGIVTDSGGLLSHAAIVAREFGIPCVVGCRIATRELSDGVMVRIDGDGGEVRIL